MHMRLKPGCRCLVHIQQQCTMPAPKEWRPDRGHAKVSRVALLQLASSSVAVLVRTSTMGWRLPPCVQALFR